jgi:hypothetical protein
MVQIAPVQLGNAVLDADGRGMSVFMVVLRCLLPTVGQEVAKGLLAGAPTWATWSGSSRLGSPRWIRRPLNGSAVHVRQGPSQRRRVAHSTRREA